MGITGRVQGQADPCSRVLDYYSQERRFQRRGHEKEGQGAKRGSSTRISLCVNASALSPDLKGSHSRMNGGSLGAAGFQRVPLNSHPGDFFNFIIFPNKIRPRPAAYFFLQAPTAPASCRKTTKQSIWQNAPNIVGVQHRRTAPGPAGPLPTAPTGFIEFPKAAAPRRFAKNALYTPVPSFLSLPPGKSTLQPRRSGPRAPAPCLRSSAGM